MARPVRAVSPSTQGVKPSVAKMFDGRNMATRPIPVITEESDVLANRAAAARSKPQVDVVNMPSGPRPGGIEAVFGEKIAGSNIGGAAWNPSAGLEETI